ncbi:MAG: YicC family protein, partial [Candidatus Krumholzibacteria bacterium]|nr:YicC family protein [Candidatus Krumholzibacteria bacterium]
MLISMTGFGTGEATSGGSTVSVEIRSVNHRFLDLAFKLPRVLQNREQDIKDLVRARLARGRVSITMSVESAAAGRAVTI